MIQLMNSWTITWHFQFCTDCQYLYHRHLIPPYTTQTLWKGGWQEGGRFGRQAMECGASVQRYLWGQSICRQACRSTWYSLSSGMSSPVGGDLHEVKIVIWLLHVEFCFLWFCFFYYFLLTLLFYPLLLLCTAIVLLELTLKCHLLYSILWYSNDNILVFGAFQ